VLAVRNLVLKVGLQGDVSSLHLRISYAPERRWASRYLPAEIPGNIASFHADVMRVAGRMTSSAGSGEPKLTA
jgi:hypothetical protein